MRKVLCIVCLVAVLLSGCSETVVEDETIDMTEQEIEFLCRQYTDGERIRSGKLFSHQEEALRELRAGVAYLAEKYPDGSYEVTDFTPATKFNNHAILTVVDGDSYVVFVDAESEWYHCSDTYFGKYLAPLYNQYVEGVLKSGGFECKVDTDFYSASAVLGPETTVGQLLDIAPKQSRSVDIFIVGHVMDVDSMQELLRSSGLYGAYTLYFVDELTDIESMLEGRRGFDYVAFNCFDI